MCQDRCPGCGLRDIATEKVMNNRKQMQKHMYTGEANQVRNFIKGKIGETVFEEMMRKEARYDVIPFGYEHTMPTLAQYQDHVEIKEIIKNISEAPDFVLVSHDKTKVYLVEVKYQSKIDLEHIKKYAEDLGKRWKFPWLFVATPEGFYCGLCKDILSSGDIPKLSENWAQESRQQAYLQVLKEFC